MKTVMYKQVVLGLLLGFITQIQSKAIGFNENEIIEQTNILNDDKLLYVADDDGKLVPIIMSDDSENLKYQKIDIPINEDFKYTTAFMLYTKQSSSYERLYLDDEQALSNSNFDPEKHTRFITHGWTNSNASKSCTEIRDAYLQRGNYNIIVFDWSTYSKLGYITSVKYVQPLGQYIAKMIDFLVKNSLDTDVLTLIGHSLGAHLVGVAGYHTSEQVHQIVGLDPALPLFSNKEPGSRISNLDAKHVEIIHSDAGSLGFKKAIGHFDFYPNGGSKQLGCENDVSCSHSRSWMYYAESLLSSTGFYAAKCNSYEDFQNNICDKYNVIMGNDRLSLPHNGTYFLTTNDKYPFSQGKLNLIV